MTSLTFVLYTDKGKQNKVKLTDILEQQYTQRAEQVNFFFSGKKF